MRDIWESVNVGQAAPDRQRKCEATVDETSRGQQKYLKMKSDSELC